MLKKIVLYLSTILMLILTAIPTLGAVNIKESNVTFTWNAPDAKTVFLAGTFNGWIPNATPMALNVDGIWSVTLQLEPGSYQYKFLIDGVWTQDTQCIGAVDDGYNGKNSMFLVTP